MSFDSEGILIILVFIVPGFAAYYARNYMTEVPPQERSVFEETQLSILNSILVILIQICALLLLALLPQLAFRGDFIFIAENGISSFFKSHLLRSLGYSLLWLFTGVVLGFLTGIINPIDRILQRFAKEHLRQTDVWYNVIQLGRERAKRDRTFLSVTLDNGDVYNGFLSEFSLVQKGHDSRDIALQYVTYYPDGDVTRIQDMRLWQGEGLVILNTSRITAIRVKYEDEIRSEVKNSLAERR